MPRDAAPALIWITHDLSVVAGLADAVVRHVRRPHRRARARVDEVLDAPLPSLHARACSTRCRAATARGAPLRADPGHDAVAAASCRRAAPSASAARAPTDDLRAEPPLLHARRPARRALLPSAAVDEAPTAPRCRSRDRRRCSSCAASRSASSSRSTSPAQIAQRCSAPNVREEVVHAVDRVDLAVTPGRGGRPGRRVGLRQVDARPARRRACSPPSAGERFWRGRDVDAAAARASGARQQLAMQMIFQDPYASLNPRMRVVDIVGEAPVVHGLVARAAAARATSRTCCSASASTRR